MSSINKPKVSRAIAFSYGILLIFIALIAMFFIYAAFFTPMGLAIGGVASIVTVFVGVIIFLILVSLYRTRYILSEEDLTLRTTFLIGGSKTIPLKTVHSVEKILMPFGFKLFGASFHGGYYHVPGLGRAFLTITNFKDCLLIKTDHRNYVITPSKPLDFKKEVLSKIRHTAHAH